MACELDRSELQQVVLMILNLAFQRWLRLAVVRPVQTICRPRPAPRRHLIVPALPVPWLAPIHAPPPDERR